jgi:hypothetical protein
VAVKGEGRGSNQLFFEEHKLKDIKPHMSQVLRTRTNYAKVKATEANKDVAVGKYGEIYETTLSSDGEKIFRVKWFGYYCPLPYKASEISIVKPNKGPEKERIKILEAAEINAVRKKQKRVESYNTEMDKVWESYRSTGYDWKKDYEPVNNTVAIKDHYISDSQSTHLECLKLVKQNENIRLVIHAGAVVYSMDPTNAEFGKRGLVVENVYHLGKLRVLWEGYLCALYYSRDELAVMKNGDGSNHIVQMEKVVVKHYDYVSGVVVTDNSLYPRNREF